MMAKLKEEAHFMWDIIIHCIPHEGLIGKHRKWSEGDLPIP